MSNLLPPRLVDSRWRIPTDTRSKTRATRPLPSRLAWPTLGAHNVCYVKVTYTALRATSTAGLPLVYGDTSIAMVTCTSERRVISGLASKGSSPTEYTSRGASSSHGSTWNGENDAVSSSLIA